MVTILTMYLPYSHHRNYFNHIAVINPGFHLQDDYRIRHMTNHDVYITDYINI
jgi:predicted amidohydrolase